MWFKNWRSLKSVHAVEHFHILLHDPNTEFVRKITNQDVSSKDKLNHAHVMLEKIVGRHSGAELRKC